MNMKYTTENFENQLLGNFLGFSNIMNSVPNILETTRPKYPPTNVIDYHDGRTVIEMAVAGFTRDDIEITVQGDDLWVTGEIKKEDSDDGTYRCHGISRKSWRQGWKKHEFMHVVDSTLENGILRIVLEKQVPETAKPRIIDIK